MSYLVLARKWRPQTFQDLIGQEHVCRTLQNAIESGRVAHAFLFTGARGVGKTSAARILAKALQCENGPVQEPCNVCPACLEITSGNSVDVIEIDGASNTGVEDIRELRENIKYLPSRCRFKIFIIDEVHMLSTSAFNALLKTLEEPPPHVKFIFATTEPHKVPITILSRCQRFDFKRIPLPKIVDRLRTIVAEEKVAVSEASLTAIARKGDGSMRDSLSTLDQVLAFCGNDVEDDEVIALLGVVDRRLLLETSRAVFDRDCQAALDIVARVDSFGYNMRSFCQELIDHFRNFVVLKVSSNPAELLDLAEGELEDIREQATAGTLDQLQRYLSVLLKAESEMPLSGFTRLILEMALLKMCTLLPVVPVDELIERLKALEGGGGNNLPPPSVTPRAPQATVPAAARSVEMPAITPPSAGPSPSAPILEGWPGFVAFVNSEKKSLGKILEHGRPLQFSAKDVEIGFPAGSFHLSCLQDAETLATLTELAARYCKAAPTVRLTSLNGENKGLPSTVQEKKSLEADGRQRKLEEAARKHPLVTAAVEIFEAEITEVSALERDAGAKEEID
ncbi:MAG: DNA polymerase III subunit gamma/tau [Deltaproteobacteria bacterium]|nr:DNA polymerase III subunit gamma/tau [Deltaproteobacteria bacterium]TLN03621.1 MAG: DNA polymerase III subunit gamma/tau [bacterium]